MPGPPNIDEMNAKDYLESPIIEVIIVIALNKQVS